MKKWISLLLTVLILLSCSGCQRNQKADFYYTRGEIQYGIADGVISGETRNLPGDDKDLEFLLKLYLEGPVSKELVNPFPKGTSLLSLVQTDKTIFLTFSDAFAQQESLEYIISCACIASTCFSLTDAYTVTIVSNETSITMTRENLILSDLTKLQD